MVAQVHMFAKAVPENPRVLICDDEPKVVSALIRQLGRLHIPCVSDTSSELVLELARKYRPQVIILDIHQAIDGRDLLQRLKKDPETAACKVIVLSGVEDQFTRQTCLGLGAEDYDVKPFDPCFINKIARLAGVDPNQARRA